MMGGFPEFPVITLRVIMLLKRKSCCLACEKKEIRTKGLNVTTLWDTSPASALERGEHSGDEPNSPWGQ